MQAEPDRVDAEILLHVMEVYLSEPVAAARRFWHALPDGLGLAGLSEAYPRGSEGSAHIDTLMIFWETIGGLLKRGLLREDLAV
jgi:hypothetical protein